MISFQLRLPKHDHSTKTCNSYMQINDCIVFNFKLMTVNYFHWLKCTYCFLFFFDFFLRLKRISVSFMFLSFPLPRIGEPKSVNLAKMREIQLLLMSFFVNKMRKFLFYVIRLIFHCGWILSITVFT